MQKETKPTNTQAHPHDRSLTHKQPRTKLISKALYARTNTYLQTKQRWKRMTLSQIYPIDRRCILPELHLNQRPVPSFESNSSAYYFAFSSLSKKLLFFGFLGFSVVREEVEGRKEVFVSQRGRGRERERVRERWSSSSFSSFLNLEREKESKVARSADVRK